jgi:carboxypeptidase Taq
VDRPADAYAELIRRVREIALLESCGSLLHWDQQTYMPPRGAAHRAEQMGVVAGLTHRQFTAPEVGELLSQAEAGGSVDGLAAEAVNLRGIRRDYDRARRLPESLVVELARVTALAQHVWLEARRERDFSRFQPWLEKIVGLKRQEAAALGFPEVAYDALLEDYEPGETTARVRSLLEQLRDELVPLIAAIVGSGRAPDRSILQRPYPIEPQRALCLTVAEAIGFDFRAGRLDVSAHPFCSGIGPGDTRMTTRFDPTDLGDALFSVLHESGHGLYDQGLPGEHHGTPMGSAVSLGIHESQSRLWENLVGRSPAFWDHFYPRVRAAFPEALGRVDQEAFVFAVNDVRPSCIRVDADEATYNLHILLRFELEQALLHGELAPADVPRAWDERMERYLGIRPPDDAQGCLQDIHWSGGGIGYFPTYTLGNLYAAQFFEQARAELGDLDEQIRRGEFGPLKDWLTEKVYRQGKRYEAGKLVLAVTGRPLSHRPLMDHLRRKYAALYGLANT